MNGVALAFFVLWTALLWWFLCRADARLREDLRRREVTELFRARHQVRRLRQ